MRFSALTWCCFLLAGGVPAESEIRLKTRNLGDVALRRSLARPARSLHESGRHYLLRFGESPGAAAAAALEAAGARIVARVSADAWTAVGGDSLPELLAGVAEVGRLAPEDKLSPALADGDSAWLAVFHADVTLADAQTIVQQAGLDLLDHPDLLPNHVLVTGDPGRIAALAEWDEVAYIFPASPELVAGEHVTACNGALIAGDAVAEYALSGGAWPVSGQDGAALQYFFQSLTGKVARTTAESEIIRAFQEWARYARLRFSPAASATAPRTISVLFARRDHGDGYPFDGRGRVLAHTFYPSPPNREPLAGDMHFDDDEDWHAGSTVDLFTVALHEAGHALGLAHSDRPGSVMYPYYHQTTGLTADDIAGIRALYGNRDGAPAPPATPPLALTVLPTPATTSAATLALQGAVEHATGAPHVTWSCDRGGSGTAAGGASWTIAAVPLASGANVITLWATDQAGGAASQSITITRQSANPGGGGGGGGAPGAPPELRITYPASSILSTSLASVALRGTAASAGGIDRVTWSNSTGGSGPASGTVSWTADVPLLAGTNMITIRAYDAAGSSSWRAVTVVRR